MTLPDIPEPDARTRRLFEIELRIEAEYAELDRRIAGYLSAMQRELERLIEGDD